jgi:hypothetical protein
VTIVSRHYGFIFLKTRKTAGSSIEQWLAPHLGRRDMIATAHEAWPVPVRFWATPDPTTRFAAPELALKRQVGKLIGRPRALRLREHASAAKVLGLVGESTWNRCFKFCVERQPWDRFISFWRWRQQRYGARQSIDEFLDLLEHEPRHPLVRGFSNLHIYTIDGRIAVDRVVRYDTLAQELAELRDRFHLPAELDRMPKAKSGLRSRDDDVSKLSSDQVDRISRLAAQEIDLMHWTTPIHP